MYYNYYTVNFIILLDLSICKCKTQFLTNYIKSEVEMKQKYTLTVADAEINVITDEPREAIDTIVGVVDRRIREIHLKSRNCSRTEAALLLCLDYCAEKLKLQKKIKMADAEINRLITLNDAAARENAALAREVETLRQSLNMKPVAPAPKTKISTPLQLSINEELKNEEKYTPYREREEDREISQAARDEILSAPADEAIETADIPADEPEAEELHILDEPVVREEAPVEEAPGEEAPAPVEPPKKKRVRSMFDLITFDKL